MVTEGGWDIGAAAGCLLIALLLWLGIPMWLGILTSLGGTALGFFLLRRYYTNNPVAAVEIGTASY